MKLSRLWGAAVTWGVLFGGGIASAQIPNYYSAMNQPYAAMGQAPSPYLSPSAAPPAYYPLANNGLLAANPATSYAQFNAPSNGMINRLPTYGSVASLANQPPVMRFNAPSLAQMPTTATPVETSVLTGGAETIYPTAPVGAGVYGNAPVSAIGPIQGPMANPVQGYNPLVQQGYNAPIQNYNAPIQGYNPAVQQGFNGPVANGPVANSPMMPPPTGQSAFQPFGSCGCGDGSCGAPACCAPCAPRWYVGAYGLIMARDSSVHSTFSFDTASEDVQFTDSKNLDSGFSGGFATVVGHYFNCGCNAIEGVYWGWFPEDVATFTFAGNAAGNLNGIFNWDSLTYNGVTMDTLVDNAQVHALFRENDAQNVEVNLLSFSSNNGGPVRFTTLAGFRYFRFHDRLTFRADANDTGFSGEVDEVFYDINLVNNLLGFQIGGVGSYCVGQRWSFNGGAKVGLFANHIEHTSQIGGTAGTAVINNGPNAGRAFFVDNSKNDTSFIAEIFAGVGYSITPNWTASFGYRALAITGLALPTDQIFPDLRGINDVETIESQSSVILHGAFIGAQYCF